MSGEKGQEDTEITAAVAETNLRSIFSGPAFYCNRSFATRQPLGFRLTFMETNLELGEDEFRTAVFLQLPDVLALKELLDRLLGGITISTEEVPDETAE